MTIPQKFYVRSDTDLLALWRRLMGPGGFGGRSVWFVFLAADGLVQPLIIPIDDLPRRPDPVLMPNLGEVITTALAHVGAESVAALLSRPGPQAMSEDDRAWARQLRSLTPRWPLHLATANRVRVFAGDDLVPM